MTDHSLEAKPGTVGAKLQPMGDKPRPLPIAFVDYQDHYQLELTCVALLEHLSGHKKLLEAAIGDKAMADMETKLSDLKLTGHIESWKRRPQAQVWTLAQLKLAIIEETKNDG